MNSSENPRRILASNVSNKASKELKRASKQTTKQAAKRASRQAGKQASMILYAKRLFESWGGSWCFKHDGFLSATVLAAFGSFRSRANPEPCYLV